MYTNIRSSSKAVNSNNCFRSNILLRCLIYYWTPRRGVQNKFAWILGFLRADGLVFPSKTELLVIPDTLTFELIESICVLRKKERSRPPPLSSTVAIASTTRTLMFGVVGDSGTYLLLCQTERASLFRFLTYKQLLKAAFEIFISSAKSSFLLTKCVSLCVSLKIPRRVVFNNTSLVLFVVA